MSVRTEGKAPEGWLLETAAGEGSAARRHWPREPYKAAAKGLVAGWAWMAWQGWPDLLQMWTIVQTFGDSRTKQAGMRGDRGMFTNPADPAPHRRARHPRGRAYLSWCPLCVP